MLGKMRKLRHGESEKRGEEKETRRRGTERLREKRQRDYEEEDRGTTSGETEGLRGERLRNYGRRDEGKRCIRIYEKGRDYEIKRIFPFWIKNILQFFL